MKINVKSKSLTRALIASSLCIATAGMADIWCQTCYDDSIECIHSEIGGNRTYCGSKDLDVGCRTYTYEYLWCAFIWPAVQDKDVQSTVNYAEYCIGNEECH